MADYSRSDRDRPLEDALRRLAMQNDYPPTPDLASAVRGRLLVAPRPRRWFADLVWAERRAFAVAIAALTLLVALVSVLAFSPDVRTAIADRLGLHGLRITTEQVTVTPAPSPVGEYLRLGNRVTLEEAQRRVPFPIRLPDADGLGAPDEIYISYPPVGGQVALIYTPRPGLPAAANTGVGLLITEFKGDLEGGTFTKGVGGNTSLMPVTVNGTQGYWIEGEPHVFFYTDSTGIVYGETVRLVGKALVWEQDGVTLRLEADVSKEEALRIAESLR
jgi:hypothetical protein